MTLKSTLLNGLLAILLAVSWGAQAAPETAKAAPAEAPVAASPADKAAKPDSKAADKAAAAQKAGEQKMSKSNPAKDRNRHLHPRDGK